MMEKLTSPSSPLPRVDSPTITVTDCNQISAVACLADYIITVDSQHAIRLLNPCSPDDETIVGDTLHTLPAHGDAVLGVNAGLSQPNVLDASYYTWAADGTIIFWDQGTSKGSLRVPLEQMEGPDVVWNELKTAHVSADGSFLVTGDKHGVLR